VLSFVQTRAYRQELVALGQDVAGTRHTLTVLAQVARRTIGPPAPGGGFGTAIASADGAQGLLAFRDLLMRPRRPLRFDVGNRTFVDIVSVGRAGVPAGDATDMENGPKPLACNIIGFNSVGSVEVEYTIQWTARNPCPGAAGMAVLAHAWKGEDDISEDFYLTRTYTGVIHFDAAVVGPGSGSGGIHPDRLRRLLLPPRTPGTHRRQVLVKNLEDGYTMAYKIVDQQPQAFVNSTEVTRIEATHSLVTTKPSDQEVFAARAEWMNAVAGGGVRVFGQPGGFFGDPDPQRKDPRGFVQIEGERMSAIAGGLAGAIWAAKAAAFNGIPISVHSFEATAYGTPYARYSELARAARVVVLYRYMRGTLVGSLGMTAFGGKVEQFDSTTPKSTTVRMVVTSRPVSMSAGTEGVQWAKGKNTMLTIVGNGPATRQDNITTVNNQQIPADIRQLMYEGTIQGAPGNWGWVDAAFAPDLMSSKDAGFRDDGLYPRQNVDNPMQLMLIRALQDPCAYTSQMAGPFVDPTPLRTLP